ncbi:reverse transcriptase [Gossypium australe]|uniref:Reverse transcriptase n=1 Tax=Gossypium australe TaxID=47621 RepID=A0A5B6VNW0_9ROSI|nr:reverse transcriptase [Gossypium australe]
MACFLLPKSFCFDLESIIVKFWWQKGHDQRGIHWCTWNELCISKEQRGLGFSSLINLIFFGWRLINYLNSLLAQVLKAKYFPTSNFIHAQLGNLPSLT